MYVLICMHVLMCMYGKSMQSLLRKVVQCNCTLKHVNIDHKGNEAKHESILSFINSKQISKVRIKKGKTLSKGPTKTNKKP